MEMESPRPLLGSGTRGAFKQLMTDSTLTKIDTAFRDEGFMPDQGEPPDGDSSVRRTRTQVYLDAIDWTEPAEVKRALRAFERLLVDVRPDDIYGSSKAWDGFVRNMQHDGYEVTDAGHVTTVASAPWLDSGILAGLRSPEAIVEQLERIRTGLGSDPALAVGSAHDLIESTAKTVLSERGVPWNDRKDDLPALVNKAQEALGLRAVTVTPGPDGAEPVRRILGAAASMAIGVGELRNRYGTGHGRHGQSGLRARHARLAVHAAMTWCLLMLDTLQDSDAPWCGGVAGSSEQHGP